MTNRSQNIDMSPDAIDLRLREVAQLYRLGMLLKGARRSNLVSETSPVAPTHSTRGNDDFESVDRFAVDAVNQKEDRGTQGR